MKDTHFLYSITTLAIGSIIAIFVSYATDALPTHTPRSATAAIATTPATKNCSCCTKMTPQELKAAQQQHEEFRKHQQNYREATELLKQYGLEEALQRIKQLDPKIAAQLQQFITKYD